MKNYIWLNKVFASRRIPVERGSKMTECNVGESDEVRLI